MRFLAVAFCLISSAGISRADESVQPAETSAAIEKGLTFLVKDALAWNAKYHCASCHHAGLVVRAMREAKLRGIAVDEPVLADLTKSISEGEGKTGVPRPAGIPKAFNAKAIYFAHGLGTDPKRDEAAQSGLQNMLKTVKEDQIDDGSWAAWPETRPPIFGPSNDSVTADATLALLPLAESDPAAKAARDRGVQWLVTHKTDDDPQSVALRVVLWSKLGRPTEESAPLVARIRERQNSDGGWSQSKEMGSDAWATGQALYALAHAGAKPEDPAIARGHAFLVKAQKEDGSWPMTSRPIKPGGEGSKNLVPIIGAGSAWAVLGLVRSR